MTRGALSSAGRWGSCPSFPSSGGSRSNRRPPRNIKRSSRALLTKAINWSSPMLTARTAGIDRPRNYHAAATAAPSSGYIVGAQRASDPPQRSANCGAARRADVRTRRTGALAHPTGSWAPDIAGCLPSLGGGGCGACRVGASDADAQTVVDHGEIAFKVGTVLGPSTCPFLRGGRA